MPDISRPHKWPGMPADGDPECIAWKCAACGEWVDDGKPRTDCSVDWRDREELIRRQVEDPTNTVIESGSEKALKPSDPLARAHEAHKIVADGSVNGPAAAFEHNTYEALLDVAEAARKMDEGSARSLSGPTMEAQLTFRETLATLEARIKETTDE